MVTRVRLLVREFKPQTESFQHGVMTHVELRRAVVIYSISAVGGEEQHGRHKQKVVKVIRNNLYKCRTERTNCKSRAYIRKNQTWN